MWKNIKNIFRAFGAPSPDYRRSLSEFNRSLMLIVDLDQLLGNIAGKIMEITGANRIAILLVDLQGERFAVKWQYGYADLDIERLSLLKKDRLIKWLEVNETYFVPAESSGIMDFLGKDISEILEKLDVQLVIPLMAINRLNGIVFLSKGKKFTRNEIEFLMTLRGPAGLAFENAALYEQQKLRLRRLYRAERLATTGLRRHHRQNRSTCEIRRAAIGRSSRNACRSAIRLPAD